MIFFGAKLITSELNVKRHLKRCHFVVAVTCTKPILAFRMKILFFDFFSVSLNFLTWYWWWCLSLLIFLKNTSLASDVFANSHHWQMCHITKILPPTVKSTFSLWNYILFILTRKVNQTNLLNYKYQIVIIINLFVSNWWYR